jgi:hypothetical protein
MWFNHQTHEPIFLRSHALINYTHYTQDGATGLDMTINPDSRPGSRVDAAFSLSPPAIVVAPLRSKAQELEAVYVSLGVSSRRAIVTFGVIPINGISPDLSKD